MLSRGDLFDHMPDEVEVGSLSDHRAVSYDFDFVAIPTLRGPPRRAPSREDALPEDALSFARLMSSAFTPTLKEVTWTKRGPSCLTQPRTCLLAKFHLCLRRPWDQPLRRATARTIASVRQRVPELPYLDCLNPEAVQVIQALIEARATEEKEAHVNSPG